MKKYILPLLFSLVSFAAFSQKGISYQAIILDPNPIEAPGVDIAGQPLVNGEVWMKFSIYNGSALQFEEIHKTKTDAYGLLSLLIGSVSPTAFNSVVWDANQKNMQVFASFDQGASYTKVSEQKLVYTPYALFSETAGKLGGTLAITGGGTGATSLADARVNLGIDKVDNTPDAVKPISAAVQAALDLKANSAEVTAALTLKANAADVTAALAAKADTVAIKTYVDNRLASGNFTATQSSTAATITDADASTKGKIQLAGDLGGTAAAPTVPGLALKANTSDVITALALKANTADVSTALTLKADTTYVLAKLAATTIADADASTKGKIQLAGDLGGTADAPTVPGLALKANEADVTTALALKANTTDVTTALALKANAVDFTTLTNRVNTNTQSITSIAYDFATLNTHVASNTTSITANATAIAAEAARATAVELILTNNVSSNNSSITSNIASINLKAPLESPTFTGTVTTGAINSGAMSATSVNTPIYASTPQALTDAATITWNPANGLNASVTLGGNRTLSFSSTLAAGSSGTLVITQDVTGGRTITLPSTTNKVLGSNSTTSIALSEASGATDILNFYYDGTNCFWNIGQGYGINGTTNLSSSVSGKLPVANGGTGANTLTGIVKGNGTSALTAAIAGTDYQAPISLTTTGTGSATLSGTNFNIPLVSSTVNTSTLSGTVALTNGGTGQTTIAGLQSILGLAGTKVAIGSTAGATTQGAGAIAIGNASGNLTQGSQSIAIGYVAGQSNQGANSVAIGSNAAQAGQGTQSVAIGLAANSAANNATALGANASAGHTNATALGFQAATTAINTIQLGADGVTVVGSTAITNVKTSGTFTAGTVTYPNTHNSTAGQLLSINATGAATWATPVSSGSTHAVGEVYGGGIVFYTWDGGAHGLIGANTELNSGQAMSWGGGSGTYVGTTSFYGVLGGKLNTQRILNVIPVPTYGNGDPQTGQRSAAYWAAIYLNGPVVVSGVTITPQFSDWYLPNAYELTLFATQSSYFPNCNFATHDHWSSSERSDYAYLAYALGANSNTNTYQDNKSSTKYVVAIRSF